MERDLEEEKRKGKEIMTIENLKIKKGDKGDNTVPEATLLMFYFRGFGVDFAEKLKNKYLGKDYKFDFLAQFKEENIILSPEVALKFKWHFSRSNERHISKMWNKHEDILRDDWRDDFTRFNLETGLRALEKKFSASFSFPFGGESIEYTSIEDELFLKYHFLMIQIACTEKYQIDYMIVHSRESLFNYMTK